jgi:hypothetical protein
LTIQQGQTGKDITVQKLKDTFGKLITRVPIFDHEDKIKCLIHQSMLYKFISDRCCAQAQAGKPIDLNMLSLEDFLGHPGMEKLTVTSLAFVSKNAKLADAKAVMDETDYCQDVLITENGCVGEPVLGWLTNVDIEKRIEA